MARSFRLVCEASEISRVEDLLRAQGFDFEPEPFHGLCRRLTAEPFPLGASLAARFGLVYIQDRSSMLPPLALAPPPGAAVLDMCASPGGKTSFLAQLAGREGFVLGNEPGADRLATLRRNLACMNLPQAATTGMKGQDLPLPEAAFGHILLDPPCSGWGTAEKNPRVLDLWTPDKAQPLAALQRELLAKASTLLAPGGRLLYSTCTTNVAENEEQALWAVRELGLELAPLAPFAGFSFHEPLLAGAEGTLRVDSEGSEAQGFYLALLVKPGGAATPVGPPGPDAEGVGGPVRDGASDHIPARCVEDEGRVQDPAARGATRREPRERTLRACSGREKPLKRAPREREAGFEALVLEDVAALAPDLAWDALPPGWLEPFKDELCFLPERGRGLLPPRRKGQRLGSLSGGVFRPWGRARVLAPLPGAGPCLDADDPEVLRALLEGRSVGVSPGAARMGLAFRGLPLGFLAVKGARALWSDR
ncbi:Ribosomal RNA small subunit methyltransferase F [Fundidesulfovibrio magnetotacticus]|uniref:Ribosomal RNA small subunit methyltransferase F n=1 Tax=Fundidesulfovibrio magnetotacticus TaxID=2730080 RepID=A0A6V8LS11_9BACT|nr:RsmB/NOP family class I SAM-dependent RNA methyltransferase [Fundidesulfovibrio magnetotacticus]GFK95253.1 Ribosomal RNA small subunit methyltransferase F [Fundidesulfovibrio magnetotacticus]